MGNILIENTDLLVSQICMGCWTIGGGWSATKDIESIRTIQMALSAGINFFDTAPTYGHGHSEAILGAALRGKRREDIVIATKCGRHSDKLANRWTDNSPDSIFRQCDESLRRLGTDYIDIYQIHWPDEGTPIEHTMEAMFELKKAGKIRCVGVSNFPLDQLAKAHSHYLITLGQYESNLIHSNITNDISIFARKQKIALFAYRVLMGGWFTNRWQEYFENPPNDWRENVMDQQPKFRKRLYDLLQGLSALALDSGRPIAQLVIGWALSRKSVSGIILGMRNSAQVIENCDINAVELSCDEIAAFGSLLDEFAAQVE